MTNAFRAALGVAALSMIGLADAADHGDTPNLIAIPRHDARISDLHVFLNGDKLVLALSTFPNLPATTYQFAADLTLRFHIDNHSRVAFDNAIDNAQFGGRVVKPQEMGADIVLEFTFDNSGAPILNTTGLSDREERDIRVFAGLRDDPFIRGPQIGRNVASIVVEFPATYVLNETNKKACARGMTQSCLQTILVWATSKVPDISGPQSELGGRAMRSQCGAANCNAVDGPDLNLRNQTSPAKYARVLGIRPDVNIYDMSRPAGFPNGRIPTDDVVSLVAPFGQNLLANDFPCPTANDVAFLATFPYLAPPQFGATLPGTGPACSS